MSTETLIATLIERQGTESDAVFAKRLGVNRETWRLLKRGTGRPGRKVLRGVMRAFPDLQLTVASSLLSENASILTVPASEVNS